VEQRDRLTPQWEQSHGPCPEDDIPSAGPAFVESAWDIPEFLWFERFRQKKSHLSVRGTRYFEATRYKLSLALTLSGAQTGLLYYSNALHLSHVIFSTWKQLHSFHKRRGWMCSLHSQGMSEFASFKLFDNFLYPWVTQIVLQWVTQGKKKRSHPWLHKFWTIPFRPLNCDSFSVPPLSPLCGSVQAPFSLARTRRSLHGQQAFEDIYRGCQPNTTQEKRK